MTKANLVKAGDMRFVLVLLFGGTAGSFATTLAAEMGGSPWPILAIFAGGTVWAALGWLVHIVLPSKLGDGDG